MLAWPQDGFGWLCLFLQSSQLSVLLVELLYQLLGLEAEIDPIGLHALRLVEDTHVAQVVLLIRTEILESHVVVDWARKLYLSWFESGLTTLRKWRYHGALSRQRNLFMLLLLCMTLHKLKIFIIPVSAILQIHGFRFWKLIAWIWLWIYSLLEFDQIFYSFEKVRLWLISLLIIRFEFRYQIFQIMITVSHSGDVFEQQLALLEIGSIFAVEGKHREHHAD